MCSDLSEVGHFCSAFSVVGALFMVRRQQSEKTNQRLRSQHSRCGGSWLFFLSEWHHYRPHDCFFLVHVHLVFILLLLWWNKRMVLRNGLKDIESSHHSERRRGGISTAMTLGGSSSSNTKQNIESVVRCTLAKCGRRFILSFFRLWWTAFMADQQ